MRMDCVVNTEYSSTYISLGGGFSFSFSKDKILL